MRRTFWDDLVDLGIGVAAVVGVVAIANALSNPRKTQTQPRQYAIADLRVETQAGFNMYDGQLEQLRNRIAVLEKENARLRPFADFLESKQKEVEQQKRLPIPKPKLHLWR
jgi:hypothetical protein